MNFRHWAAFIGVLGMFVASPAFAREGKPNIVIILADDLGYGDIGVFGAADIATPHIDGLAAKGIRFTDFYAGHNVCSPSRAALLTGRHSKRMGISHVFQADSPDGMPLEEITIAEMLKQSGYATGMVGKWHLGSQDRYMPWNQGFDSFQGVPYSNDMGNFFWYDEQDVVYEPIDQAYLTQRYTEKALDFIVANKEEPFFLYVAHSMPHVPIYASPDFLGTSERGLYGDVIQELDWSVGEVVAALDNAGILEDTLILFTSDNGPWLPMGSHGGETGGLRDGKGTTFDGGHKVPAVAYLGGGVAGVTVTEPISMLDLLPTIATLTGGVVPIDRTIDGRDVSAIFTGNDASDPIPYFYYEAFNRQIDAVRLGEWKLKREKSFWVPDLIMSTILRWGEFNHNELLFNLESDPGETNNLVDDNPQVAVRLRALMVGADSVGAEYRMRIMTGTGADRAGYEGLLISLAVVALALIALFFGLLYGLWRGGKAAVSRLRT
jgi:arylsulfatase A-like enzyme